MKCPECGKECRKGFIEAKEIGSITQFFTSVIWYPEDEKDKWIRNNTVHLSHPSEFNDPYDCSLRIDYNTFCNKKIDL